MIVVDSSALVAILDKEPGYDRLTSIIEAAPRRVISSVTDYETGIVMLGRRGTDGLVDLANLFDAFDFEIVAFDRSHSDAALAAYARFGKGRDPAAALNMGDCVPYALAMMLGAPLLFKGNDFAATDVARCG